MKTSITEILENALIGKSIEVTTFTPVYETYTEEIKKSKNVTDKQFESGEKRFRMTATRTRRIDDGKKVEILKITEVHIGSYDFCDCDDIYEYVRLVLEGGKTKEFSMNETIELL